MRHIQQTPKHGTADGERQENNVTDPGSPGPTWESFPLDARLAWMELSPDVQEKILEAAWCAACMKPTAFTILSGRVSESGLILGGRCEWCGGEVGRLVER